MVPFSDGNTGFREQAAGLFVAVHTLVIRFPALPGKVRNDPVSSRFLVHIVLGPDLPVIHLIIDRTALGIDHAEIGFHAHRLGQRVDEMFEILHRRTDFQRPVHQIAFLVHLIGRHIILLQVIRRRIHDAEPGTVRPGPNLLLQRYIRIDQTDKRILLALEPPDIIRQMTRIPMLEHHRLPIGPYLSADDHRRTAKCRYI